MPEAAPGTGTLGGSLPVATGRPYTKWYNVHERHSLSEFKTEGLILIVTTIIFVFHFIGTRINRTKAKAWMKANARAMQNEFAAVGFDRAPNMDADSLQTDKLIREKSLCEFTAYATGRQNAAFMDVNLSLTKKYNPLMLAFEMGAAFMSETFGEFPEDTVEAVIYPFDGKESLTVPMRRDIPEEEQQQRGKDFKSSFDGFVWAIVNKSRMQKLRDERYDLSLTATKDNSKLPEWLSVMSESAEVTDTFLTKELAEVIKNAGDNFHYLVISDQPTDSPKKLEDTTPRKRIMVKYTMPSSGNYDNMVPLLEYFMRIPDLLAEKAHFRPEVLRKLRTPRDAKINQIKKADEEERADDRLAEKERLKKAKRDADLKGLDAKAQKKYLEKEQQKEQRRSQKKMTMRG